MKSDVRHQFDESTIDLLRIYFNDHRAGSVAGRAIAQRCAKANDGNGIAAFLRGDLLPAIVDEQRYVDTVADALGLQRNPLKELAARGGELVGRAKLNGRLREYSPLSRVEELEMLLAGVHTKMQLWITLNQLDVPAFWNDEGDPEHLIDSGRRQIDSLDELHRNAVLCAFALE